MIIDVLKQFSSIIRNYQIDKFRTFESAHEIIGKIVFIDKQPDWFEVTVGSACSTKPDYFLPTTK